mgnify:CR=1 FL=1|tara:strand:+ start:3659 stop:3889 length:231 start_codon:yes stop_codon:yes gene_type:complete
MARKSRTQKNSKVGKKIARRTGKKVNKASKKTKKNSFFKLMLAAKKKGQPSFVYNNKTYKRKTGKGNKSHLIYYGL